MPRHTSRFPVISFGPELLTLLLQGGRKSVTLRFGDDEAARKKMESLQLRIHSLRGAMRREGHPDYALATRAHTSRQWDTTPEGKKTNFRLEIRPKDSEFRQVIADAGIDVEDTGAAEILVSEPIPSPSPVEEHAAPSTEGPDPFEIPENPYANFK
jgi:hypothetical protein